MSPDAAADAAFRRALERLQSALDSSAAYVWIKGADGRYIAASRRVSELAGQTVVGRTDSDLLDPAAAMASSELDRRARESRAPVEEEESFGGEPFLTVRIPLAGSDDGVDALCCVATDVRRYQLLVDRLYAVQRTELLGEIAGGVAHEFNNLLGVMSTTAELSLERIEDDETRRSIESLRNAALLGQVLSRRLLDFGHRRRRADAPTSVSAAVGRMHELLAAALGPRIAMVAELAPGEILTNTGAAEVEQVVANLVLNARDAMGGRGTIVIRTTTVQGSDAPSSVGAPLDPRRRYLCLSVSDDGPGMPARVAAQATGAFFTTKPPGRGSGLGLAMVADIAREAGGALAIESHLGVGTTVRVYLSLASRRFRRGAPALSDELTGGLILVAENEDTVREGAVRILSRAGYSVLPAAHAEEVLHILDATDWDVDLLLLDTRLRRADASFRRCLRSRMEAGTIVLVPPPDVDEPEPFLRRPFTAWQLLTTVRTALDAADGHERDAVA